VLLSLEGSNAQPLSIRAKALVFHDPVSIKLLQYIEQIGPSQAPVLIGGETGTGKELVARHLHHLSGRRGPFLAVNCGAISDHLAESELFGHEAGAFTGAQGRREGWFEAANGGTLFLDEIGDLPLALQVKLLRVLQEKEVVRLGSRRATPVDVRLVVATNVDLDGAVAAGHFRQDLLYRINIAQLRLPPLRERPGDIMPLAQHFLQSYSQKMQQAVPRFSEAAMQVLLQYSWPGNIRELENVVHFALLVLQQGDIEPQHLKITLPTLSLLQQGQVQPKLNDVAGYEGAGGNYHQLPRFGTTAPVSASASHSPPPVHADDGGAAVLAQIRQDLLQLFDAPANQPHFQALEQLIVETAWQFARHNQVHAAALLGISRNVMRTLLKRHGYLDTSRADNLSAGQAAGGPSSILERSWDFY
jgi:DNA-binding NtrC family response regulator